MTGAYLVITFGYDMRLNEGFWVDAGHLCEHIEVGNTDSRSPHMLVPLLGRFKGDNGYQMNVFTISNKTCSGIHISLWMELLVKTMKS